MTNGHGPGLPERIVQHGREVVVERLRDAFAHQAAIRDGGVDLDPDRLERMVQEAVARAGEALWRRSLAQAAMDELKIDLSEALAHPALADAQKLNDARGEHELSASEAPRAEGEPHHLDIGADAEHVKVWPSNHELDAEPAPMIADSQALRLSAVHISGIETLYQGEDDLELRLSEAGLDVLKRSNGAAIGRLEWSEIEAVDLPAPKRGLRSRRRSRELHVSTAGGQAQFELPGLTDEELHDYLEPTLARLRRVNGTPTAAESDGDAAGSPARATTT